MAAEKQPHPAGPGEQPPGYTNPDPAPGAAPPQGQAYPPGQPYPAGQTYPAGQQPPPDYAYTWRPPHEGNVQPGPDGSKEGQPVLAQPVIVIQPQSFGEEPVNCQCPHCHQNIVTRTTPEPGGLTWLIAGAMCFLGLWCGCCVIPFCITGLQDIHHSCPNCEKSIHVFRRM